MQHNNHINSLFCTRTSIRETGLAEVDFYIYLEGKACDLNIISIPVTKFDRGCYIKNTQHNLQYGHYSRQLSSVLQAHLSAYRDIASLPPISVIAVQYILL